MTLRTLNYGNYGIFLIMGNAGFCPSAVFIDFRPQSRYYLYTWSPRVRVEGYQAFQLRLEGGGLGYGVYRTL